MQGGYFSYGLLAALAIALLVAAFTDLRRRQIDNWLNAAIALGAPLYWVASGMSLTDIAWQGGVAIATFAILVTLFALRQMGGGDVKLLTALSLWFPAPAFLKLIVVMSLLGGALSVAGGVRNMKQIETEPLRNGLALAGAGLWLLLSLYTLIVIAGGPTQPLAYAVGKLTSLPAGIWLFLAIAVLAIGTIGAGLVHLSRRQQDRLKIPYGLAISGAGLWILASHYLPAMPAGPQLG